MADTDPQIVIKARRKRSTQREMALRDSRLVRRLASGQSIEEVAAGEGISLRLARRRVSAILSRSPDPPAEFAQLQMRRLNEAMIVAYASLQVGNLKAIETVLKVTREYDRYAGLALTAAEPAPPATRALPAPPLALAPPQVNEATLSEAAGVGLTDGMTTPS
jgi:hypothetical protein